MDIINCFKLFYLTFNIYDIYFTITNFMFRCRCIVAYPPNSEYELELRVGDILYVHKIRQDGWYRGTLLRTGKSGLFPSSFVEKI